MKVLFMTPDGSNDVSWSNVDYLERAIGKIVECKWAGHGHKLYKTQENLSDTVSRVMPNADWVVLSDSGQFAFPINVPKKRSYKVAYMTSDMHYPTPRQHLLRLNAGEWDAFLTQVTKTNIPIDGRGKSSPNFYIKRLNAPTFLTTFSINTDLFKPIDGTKKYDVAFLGEINPDHYPLRKVIWKKLPQLASKNRWDILMCKRPQGASFFKKRRMDTLLQEGYIVGEKYAQALATSKILIFSVIRYRYPVKKYFEGMACGTCVLANTPFHAEELHFRPDWNFVEIGKDNWEAELEYYLKHDDEREAIAKRGYETIMKYHTNDIRAKQLVTFLKEYSEEKQSWVGEISF